MAQIIINQLNKSYQGQEVLKEINLNVKTGELLSLVGPSGSGKTTLLKLIAGIEAADCGQIEFDGKPADLLPMERRGAVIVFQDYALFPHMTALENVAFGLKVRGVKRSIRKKKAEKFLSMVQLAGSEHKLPRQLSGGQRQRVAIARALAVQPDILLLDEPFSSLDTHLRDQLRRLIRTIQIETGITTILVTHDTNEALMVSDRLAVIQDGCLIQVGSPKEVYEQPATIAVADFFSENNYVKGAISGQWLKSPFGDWQVSTSYEGDVKMMIRPESFVFESDCAPMQGIVEEKFYAGDKIRYALRTDNHRFHAVCEASLDKRIGDMIRYGVDRARICLYGLETGEIL